MQAIPKSTTENNLSQNLFRLLHIQKILQKFKHNIFTKSYVLPLQQKPSIYEKFQKRDQFVKNKENKETQKFTTFNPTNLLLLIWDFIGIILNLFILWLTPFIYSFNSFDAIKFQFFMIVIDIFLAIDILINMNRGIIIQGQVVMNRKKICKNYLKNQAIYDIISLFLWIITSLSIEFNSSIIVILAMVQIIVTYCKIQYYFLNHFESFYLKGNQWSNALDLVSLIIQIYFYAHFTACVFHYTAKNTENNWLSKYGIQWESVWVKYNYAFYWATMTMTTVGYGDITAQNQIEMVCSEVIMFFSSCVFAYSMNSIGIILKSIYDSKLRYKRTLIQINQYMSQNSVDSNIQGRIRNYLHYYIDHENNDNTKDINNIVESLPSSLRQELLTDIQMKVIKQMKPFTSQFSQSTQNQLAKQLEFTKFTPGDIIYHSQDIGEQYLYFLQDGQVILQEDTSNMLLSVMDKFSLFGYYQFFTGLAPNTQAMSKGFTELYKIGRNQFLEILQNNLKDFEHFHHIKDQILLQSNYSALNCKCKFCQNNTHQEINCPIIQYKPDLEQRLKKNNYYQSFNNRQQYERKPYFKNNAIYCQQALQDNICKYLEYELELNQNDDQTESRNQEISEHIEKPMGSSCFVVEVPHKSSNEEDFERKPQPKKTQIIRDQQHFTLRPIIIEASVKQFCMLDQLLMKQNSFCIDKVKNYSKYMPHNNVDVAIQQFEKQQKKNSNKQFLQHFSKYSFSYEAQLLSYKVRQLLSKNIHEYANVAFSGPQRFTSPLQQKESKDEISVISLYSDISINKPQRRNQRPERKTQYSSKRLAHPQSGQNELEQLKLLKVMRIKNLIKRFAQILLMKSYIISSTIKSSIYAHIEDNELNKQSKEYQSDSNLFAPSNKFLLYWDFIGIISNLLILWWSPFFISFGYYDLGIIDLIIIAYLIGEILINLNRAIILQGTVIFNRKLIIQNYFSNNFKYDAISLIFWTSIGHINIMVLTEFSILLLSFSAYQKINQYFSYHFESLYLKGNLSQLIDLISLIVYIYFYAHFTGCIFYYVGDQSSYLGTSWISKMDLIDSGIWIKYNYAFYWATMTVTTVGYGDILAQNYLEFMASSIIMFLSSCVFAYSMNSIGMILKALYDAKLKYNLLLLQINQYMRKNHVEIEIQRRVRNYLKYITDQENKDNQESINVIIDMLPESLRNDLLSSIQLKVLNQMKFITTQFSKQSQSEVAKSLTALTFTPGDIIFNSNANNQNLYCIKEGQVILYEETSKKDLQPLQTGNSFGLYQFFTGQMPRVAAKSMGFTEIYTISRKSFLNIIRNNRKDFEIFHMIKDNILMNSNYQLIDLKCNFCQRFNHLQLDCPLLSYKPDLEKIIKQEDMNPVSQIRQKFNRSNGNFKYNSIYEQSRLKTEVQEYFEIVKQMSQSQPILSQMEYYDPKQYQNTSLTKILVKADSENKVAETKNIPINRVQTHRMNSQTIIQYEKVSNNFSLNIDSIKIYQRYMTHNNIQSILEQMEQFKKETYLSMLDYYSRYSFSFKCKLYGCNYRNKEAD